MIRTIFIFYCLFFVGIPGGFALKHTKDCLFPRDPSLDGTASRMAAIFACNGFSGKVAYTKEEFSELAEYNLKDCLSHLIWTVPISVVWYIGLQKAESSKNQFLQNIL